MTKILVPFLALGVLGALIWALMMPTASKPNLKKGSANNAASAAVSDDKPEVAEADEQPVKRPAVRKKTGSPVVHNALPKRAVKALSGTPAAVKKAKPTAKQYEMPLGEMSDIKNSVRAYFGNLPRNGRVPAKVTLEEVFSSTIIAALKAQPNAKMTMLGNWQIGNRKAFEEILELSPKYEQMVGVSWIGEDGKEMRQYIKVKATK